MPKQTVISDAHWPPEVMSRLWDHHSLREDLYFSKQYAGSIVELIQVILKSSGIAPPKKVLDVGSGGGHFLDCLQRSGYDAYGIEPSPPSVERAKASFPAHSQRFIYGSIGDIDGHFDGFDAAFCIEVLEHVTESEESKMLDAISGRLRPGGVLVITTPNEEVLSVSQTYCPFCDRLFHPMQHVRTINAQRLAARLMNSIWHVVHCRGHDLDAVRFPGYNRPGWSWPWFSRKIYRVINLLGDAVIRSRLPGRFYSVPGRHLICIARRLGAGK